MATRNTTTRQLHPAVIQLKSALSHQKITYDEIARKTGISRARLGNAMSGRVQMSIREFNDICDSFALPLNLAGQLDLNAAALAPDCCSALRTLIFHLMPARA